eukprot:GEMP01045628.1.p1 GENE.GEMP01045628.1~~GEMP01045628.1.p1  ORF type:complete len:477 (+),score=86.21 GEMP01045628.1:163-1593(+)
MSDLAALSGAFDDHAEKLLDDDDHGFPKPEDRWVQWGTHWLSLGCFAALLGFALADLTFLVELADNRMTSIPSSVSTAMSSQEQTAGTIYHAFMLIASMCILISFYPFTLPNASCKCKLYGSLSYRKLRWSAPSFFTLLVLIPTKIAGNDVIILIQRVVHELSALMAFFLVLWPEVHTLRCPYRPKMSIGEFRGRRLWAYASIFFFSCFLFLQLAWVVGFRIPILNMASFACEVQGSVCSLMCLLHIWHFNSRTHVTAEETRELPTRHFPKSIYAGSTLAFILLCLVLFVVHICIVGFLWNPALATMNCLDSSCSRCVIGVSHSAAGSGQCNILTNNEVFWSVKLGMACFCDGAIKDIDPLSGAHLGLRRRKRNFIRCKHPAYPYTVVTSVDIEPLEAMTFQGCAIDDVRKLHDPDLRALKRPGNPVQTYSARGVACARIPIKMEMPLTPTAIDPQQPMRSSAYTAWIVLAPAVVI